MKKEKKIIRKSNDVVAVKNNLSVPEIKLLTLILEQIKTTDRDFTTYSISVKNYENSTNTADSYMLMKRVVKRLMSRVIELPNEKFVNLFHSAQYKSGWGLMEIELHDDMKPYFLELKRNYTQYESRFILSLKSKYSMRFYEYFKKEIGIKKQNNISVFFDIEQLRKYLSIQKKFKQIGELKKRVLNSSQKEINQNTDIEFKYKDIKQGRKIIAFEFIVKKKTNDIIEIVEDAEIVKTETVRNETIKQEKINLSSSTKEKEKPLKEIKSDLKNFGFNEADIKNIFMKYDEDYIIENIVILKEKVLNGKIKQSIPQYSKGFSTDFRTPKNTFTEKQKKQDEIKKEIEQRKAKEKKEKQEKQVENDRIIGKVKKEIIINKFNKLSDEEKKIFYNEITKDNKFFRDNLRNRKEEIEKLTFLFRLKNKEVIEYFKITNKQIIKLAKTQNIKLIETEDKKLKVL